MRHFFKVFSMLMLFMFVLHASPADVVAVGANQLDSIQSPCVKDSVASNTLCVAYNTLKTSLGMLNMPNVNHDYIHQVIYLKDLLHEMNASLDKGQNLQDVKLIAEQLNKQGGVGSAFYQATVVLQKSYYVLPSRESPNVLGWKAVGTAIFEQYVDNFLGEVGEKLDSTGTGSIDNFIASNRKGYADLVHLTKEYYKQAKKSHKVSMNLGFDYEKMFLAHFKKPLVKFYKSEAYTHHHSRNRILTA